MPSRKEDRGRTTHILTLAALLSWSGAGAWLACWVVFVAQYLSVGQAAIGLTASVSVAIGVLASILLGSAADRRDPVRLLVVIFLLQALAATATSLLRTPGSFLTAAGLAVSTLTVATAIRAGYIARAYEGAQRVIIQARLRVTANIGIALGTAAAAVPLAGSDEFPFRVVFVFYALTSALAAGVMSYLPRVPAPARPIVGSPSAWALPDRRFVILTLLSGILAINGALLSVGVPLWITTQSAAPRWTISAVLVLNTIGVVLLQIRVARAAEDAARARRASTVSGALLGTSCVLVWASGSGGTVLAVAVLVLFAVVHLLGELLQAASGWSLAYTLAVEERQGSYQGFFSAGQAVGESVGPLLLTVVVLPLPWGWAGLAVLFWLAGALISIVTRGTPAPAFAAGLRTGNESEKA